ncbi:MAG: aminoacyl-tRNA hydrolase [Phycisphaerae bacterium]|nr:aminoacyl-tRNA hydrolase [Phycisphaerae bacterium]MCZ2399610.1 aminoacyl-tRNA hydrolase [Phycisphaerae bacterium]NUQ49813.1 aminoacyl-tRNA hydrolase [Phycisphaerae bacterium]
MKLVAGLGNPGPRYDGSRHNVGFEVVEELARRWKADALRFDRDYEALVGEAQSPVGRVLLLKPMTYMNLSGRSVSAVVRFYKLDAGSLMVVYDDLDLPVGQVRIRAGGSAGGHKGMADVISAVGSPDIARVRIGIGKVHRSDTVDHVLSRFAPDEREDIEQAVRTAADAVECWIAESIDVAMNRFNRRPSRDADAGRTRGEGPKRQGESS